MPGEANTPTAAPRHKPMLPISLADVPRRNRGVDEPEPEPPSPDQIQKLVDYGRELEQGDRKTWMIARQLSCTLVELLSMSISPTTGDSMLHAAAAANHLEGIRAISQFFGVSQNPLGTNHRAFHVFIAHQNFDGDTALHVAARKGHLKFVTYMFRWACHRTITDGPPGTSPSVYAEMEPFDNDPEALRYTMDRVMLWVLMKNDAGRDAAAEARLHDHEDVATLLGEIQERRDPLGLRYEAAEMRRMRDLLKARYHLPDGWETPQEETWGAQPGPIS